MVRGDVSHPRLVTTNFSPSKPHEPHRIAQRYGIADPRFERAMSQLLGPPTLGGNEVTPLHSGLEIFPAMLGAIGKAERTITFETFVY